MKLNLEIYGTNYTVDSPNDDAADAQTLMSHFKGLLVSAGFHPEAVDDIIPGESPWYPEIKLEKSLTNEAVSQLLKEDLEDVC